MAIILKCDKCKKQHRYAKDAINNIGTLWHPIKAKHSGSKVFMQPASDGTGVIAGGAIRAVMEALGVRDVLAKSIGSGNPQNTVKATMQALSQLRSAQHDAALLGNTLK